MAIWKRMIATVAMLAAPLLLGACSQSSQLYVDQAWIRLSANPDSPSAGYFTVHGGGEPVQLRAVLSDRVQRIELHESVMKDGMMTMKAIDSVDVPAGGTVAFEPGGKHLMLFGVNVAEARGDKIPLTFIFSNGDRIIVDALLRKPGGGAPPSADGGTENSAMAGGMNMDHSAH